MDEREIGIWATAAAAAPTVEAVAQSARDARDAWLVGMVDVEERRVLHLVGRNGWGWRRSLPKQQLAEIAGNAAVELAIIVDLWPRSVDQALRRPLREVR
jgi:parvulin-like peptidyl-prolyl isomerase